MLAKTISMFHLFTVIFLSRSPFFPPLLQINTVLLKLYFVTKAAPGQKGNLTHVRAESAAGRRAGGAQDSRFLRAARAAPDARSTASSASAAASSPPAKSTGAHACPNAIPSANFIAKHP
ncbi:Protein of unknown function [Gryllus bimaculatus]|nr:Protein of unknown function [Gryllus bimaculatus]